MKLLELFNADRVILGLALLFAVLYGGEWFYNRMLHPVIYKPPPGMLYLGPAARATGAPYTLWCEGCAFKKR